MLDPTPAKSDLIDIDSIDAIDRLAALMRGQMLAGPHAEPTMVRPFGPINVLAIGSDRTTGDCLGPLVGEYLLGIPGINVYGTLDAPVHAANMGEIVPEITGYTIAVDAALGTPVGAVSVRKGPLAPGAAFGRQLPSVGDIAVSGLVCEAGPLGFERLRSVRLGFVRRVAQVIAVSIAASVGRPLAATSGMPRAELGEFTLDLSDTSMFGYESLGEAGSR